MRPEHTAPHCFREPVQRLKAQQYRKNLRSFKQKEDGHLSNSQDTASLHQIDPWNLRQPSEIAKAVKAQA